MKNQYIWALALAGLGLEGLTKEMLYSGYDTAPEEKPAESPAITLTSNGTKDWVERVPGKTLSFQTAGQAQQTPLIPLYRIFGEKYLVYWKT